MRFIPFRRVVSCSSEDRIHCAENLIKPEQYKKWLSAKSDDEQINCVLEFEKESLISSIDIGNDGSAFIELFVARSSEKSENWTLLLPSTLLMSPADARSNVNRNQVKLLKSKDLNEICLNQKWDRVKIVCEQKFNRVNQFGLSFIKFSSPSSATEETNASTSNNSKRLDTSADDDEDETGKEQSKIGSFFAKKQAEKKIKPSESDPRAEIRSLSNVADELLSAKPMNDEEIQSLLKKTSENTPQRQSKRRLSDETKPSAASSDTKRNKTTDKSQLMKHVVFILSGFQNPLRSELRQKATAMGATYNDDWDKTCTHLICAFPNTPKFTQVQQQGRGSIVSKQWILDCYEQNQLLPEKNYQLTESKNNTPNRRSRRTLHLDDDDEEKTDDNKKERPTASTSVERKPSVKKTISTFDDDTDDDEEIPAKKETEKPKIRKKITTFDDDDDDDDYPLSKDVIKKPSNGRALSKLDDNKNIYDADTDEDEPKKAKKPFQLVDFFRGKHFYVDDNEYNEATLHDIRRVIYAYDGVLEKQLKDNVQYFVTNRMWNDNFAQISKGHPELKFLSLDWLQDCHDENKLVPCQPYLIVP